MHFLTRAITKLAKSLGLSDLARELTPQPSVCRAAQWLSVVSHRCGTRAQRQPLLLGLSLQAQQHLCHGKV